MKAFTFRSLLPFFLLVFVMLNACEESDGIPEKANALVAESDDVVIMLSSKTPGVGGSGIIVVDPTEVRPLQGMVTQTKTEAFKCAEAGKIVFKKAGETKIEISFLLREDCKYVSFFLEDEVHYYEISGPAEDFLIRHLPKPVSINQVEWMLGKWAQEEKDAISYEVWKRKDAETFVGEAYTVRGTDTSYSETLTLASENGKLVYIADVRKNQAPVPFTSTFMGENRVMFENRGHDFPQIIIYQMRGTDTLHARIEGLAQGTPFGKDFYLEKVEE